MIAASILIFAGVMGVGLYGVSFAAGNGGRYDVAGLVFGYPLLAFGALWFLVEFVTDLARPRGN